jgi:molybdate-binding protein
MKLSQQEKDLVAGGNRKEFIKLQKEKYDKLIEADNISRELTQRIKTIRDMGFKVIVLGSNVKVSI